MNGERERSEAGSAIKQTMSAWKKMGKSKYQGCFNSMICRDNMTKFFFNLYDFKRIIYVPIVKLMQNLFVMEGLDLSNWHTPNELVEILNNFLYFISIYVGILAKPIKKGVFWNGYICDHGYSNNCDKSFLHFCIYTNLLHLPFCRLMPIN